MKHTIRIEKRDVCVLIPHPALNDVVHVGAVNRWAVIVEGFTSIDDANAFIKAAHATLQPGKDG